MQSLLGLLNFACKVVSPGRAFCRRLINATIGIKKRFHKIRVSKTIKADLNVWLSFLTHYNGVTLISNRTWLTINDEMEGVIMGDSEFTSQINGRTGHGPKIG